MSEPHRSQSRSGHLHRQLSQSSGTETGDRPSWVVDWYPKLRDASPDQRADHRLIGDGIGIHWESLGIDLSTQGLLLDSPPTQGDEDSKPKRVSYHIVPADASGTSSDKARTASHPSRRKPKPSAPASKKHAPTKPANSSSTSRTASSKKSELTALIRLGGSGKGLPGERSSL